MKLRTEIIKIGKTCADKDVETVFISSLVFNQRVEWKRIEIINEQLKRNCMNQGFIFIDNNEISARHMWRDGIHLLEIGNIVLANNFIDYINKYVTRKDCFKSSNSFFRSDVSFTLTNKNDNEELATKNTNFEN